MERHSAGTEPLPAAASISRMPVRAQRTSPSVTLRTGAARGWAAGIAAAGMIASGCTGPNSPEQTILGLGDGIHDVFRGHRNAKVQTLRFEQGGVTGLDIESFGGNVEVVSDPRATAVVVTIRREGSHGFLRGSDSAASLERITATAEMEPGDLGPILAIRTWTTDPEPWFQSAHIRIEGPDIDGVRIHTGRGNVVAKNVGGAIDIESGGGSVRVMSERPMRDRVVVVTREGSIDYRVGPESTGFFDAETVGGAVLMRNVIGGWVMHPAQARRDHLYGTLNAGENRVLLRTVDGDIRIAVVRDPTAVGMVIVDP